MNDFSELEGELKKLRPRPVSPDLSARIEVGLAQTEAAGRGTATAGVLPKQRKFRLNWFALGLGLAAAATFLVLARVNVDRPSKSAGLALLTPAPITPAAKAVDSFVPAAMTQVVYDRKDEGLHFAEGQDEPMRRVRSRKRETVQWHNPQTGATLRVSYPKEEVTLSPVVGQ
ncbi:MAG TPA: hypothetical protein VGW57_11635 [Chthoniobacterales bacterium]|nr:hypothetical protein [Chthoniobacterales bacterium]